VSDGVHVLTATYADGRTERIPCPCAWCDLWRAYLPQINAFLTEVEPTVPWTYGQSAS
jgi:hypothetical protein